MNPQLSNTVDTINNFLRQSQAHILNKISKKIQPPLEMEEPAGVWKGVTPPLVACIIVTCAIVYCYTRYRRRDYMIWMWFALTTAANVAIAFPLSGCWQGWRVIAIFVRNVVEL
jgi:hypothetical protein